MIVLDTNIISEVMRPHPSESVVAWLNRQPGTNLFITSISLAEIGYGLRVLADGQRRRNLQNRFEEFVTQGFEYRVLDFDAAAARIYSEIMGHQKEIGSPMSFPDGQIAAITLANHFILATRNIKDFNHCGLDLVNPFE
ncbi:MAG: type II toxin-antitoxin system VapC family toxin [Methylobacter sp.]|nr:type II toxin-antitoxin system VapC family toxin [Methylobacter sp.]